MTWRGRRGTLRHVTAPMAQGAVRIVYDVVPVPESWYLEDDEPMPESYEHDQIIALRNFNPKLIWLTLGNTSNAATLCALRSAAPEIIAALNNPNRGMVELG